MTRAGTAARVHRELSIPVFQQGARCSETDPEAFFPEKGGSTREARTICFRCEVQQECLDWALGNDEKYGVWGGVPERTRRKLSPATSRAFLAEQRSRDENLDT